MTPLAATAGEQQSHVATKRRGMTIECCGKTEIVCALLPGPLVGSRSSSWPISTYRMARESSDPNSRRSDTPRHVRPALEDALKAAWLRAKSQPWKWVRPQFRFVPTPETFCLSQSSGRSRQVKLRSFSGTNIGGTGEGHKRADHFPPSSCSTSRNTAAYKSSAPRKLVCVVQRTGIRDDQHDHSRGVRR